MPDFSMQTSYHVCTGYCVQKDPVFKRKYVSNALVKLAPGLCVCCSHNCIKITKKEDLVLS